VELPIWRRDYRAGLEPDSEVTQRLEDYDKVAIDLGLRAAPAMVVAGQSGTKVLQDSPDLATVRQAINTVR
jgi:protein-disulfide isomerase